MPKLIDALTRGVGGGTEGLLNLGTGGLYDVARGDVSARDYLNPVSHGRRQLGNLSDAVGVEGTRGFWGPGGGSRNRIQNPDGTVTVTDNANMTRTFSPDEIALYDQYGVDPLSKTAASDIQASLAREDWQRYQQAFVPLENALVSTLNNPKYRQEQAQQAYTAAGEPFPKYEEAARRRVESYGLNVSPEQQKAIERNQAFTESTTKASAYNNALRLAQDRETKLLGAGLVGAPKVGGQ